MPITSIGLTTQGAKKLLESAGVTNLKLDYVVDAGNEVYEQTVILLQQQMAAAGITVKIRKVDQGSIWDELVAGNYDLAAQYWTDDIVDPDEKTTFVLGHDSNNNFMTNYKNDAVKDLVAKARVEFDPEKRKQMHVDLQKMAKADVNWIDLFYSPYRNVCQKNVENFGQTPLGRLTLEDTKKN